jgi:hypothetical protein
MKKSELREIIREELGKLNEGKVIKTVADSISFYDALKLGDKRVKVVELDGGKRRKKEDTGLRLFKSVILPELRQAFASSTPVVGLSGAEASKISPRSVAGFKIGDLYYAVVPLEGMTEGKGEGLMSGYLSSGGKELRKTGEGAYDGDYANGWGKREFDLFKALKPFEVSATEKEIGRARHQITKTYKDGGKKWTITYKVDSGD